MDNAAITLWEVAIDTMPSNAELALLDANELARANRFAFERHRRRYLAAHVALRQILGNALACDPAALGFGTRANGKPCLVETMAPEVSGMDFNLSHSGELAVVALAQGPVGVDVELVRRIDDAGALAQRHFSATECAHWHACERTAQANPALGSRPLDRVFLTGWVRKEACVKAIGAGLLLDTRGIEVGLDDTSRTLQIHWDRQEHNVMLTSVAARDDAQVAVARCVERGTAPQMLSVTVRQWSGG